MRAGPIISRLFVISFAAALVAPGRPEAAAARGPAGIHLSVLPSPGSSPITDSIVSGADWTAEGNQSSARFGDSVGTAGDVNGDGFADVIVGADSYDNGQVSEGRAFVYHGSASGLTITPAWMAESNQEGAVFGASVGTAGDVNGDGFDDVIVGASGYNNGQFDEGRAFVYHGSASGLSLTPAWMAESDQVNARFGASVGTAGDVNGDGFGDVVVGAPLHEDIYADEGRAFVYHGSASGLSLTSDWTADGGKPQEWFGASVGTAGDVNGDGFDDVIVGAPLYNEVGQDLGEGWAFAYHGSTSGLSLTPTWTAEGDQEYAGFGGSVGTAGDVNGDGFADVIVGAYGYENPVNLEGAAFAYHGSASGLTLIPSWMADGGNQQALFGYSVGTAGDVTGDGFDEVIVGAIGYDDDGQINEGGAFVYPGSPSGLRRRDRGSPEGDQEMADFGHSVGTAGDVNGDGVDDVIVGAPRYDNGQADEGRAFAWHGQAPA